MKKKVLLMDVVMPKMDGLAACRALRELPSTRATPIILVTTRGEPFNVEAGYSSGCSDYVTKPVDGAELLEKVAVYLEHQNREIGQRLSEAEERIGELSRLHVASQRLHGSFDRAEVLLGIAEIVADPNLAACIPLILGGHVTGAPSTAPCA
jgi:DNA-binding response OmpR family regulator